MSEPVKIVVYVPTTHAAAVREAMGAVGAGQLGNYSYCSFSVTGTGRFKPLVGAHPTIGMVGQLTEVEEERIETICDRPLVKKVIAAIKAVHPYEEPGIDVYQLI